MESYVCIHYTCIYIYIYIYCMYIVQEMYIYIYMCSVHMEILQLGEHVFSFKCIACTLFLRSYVRKVQAKGKAKAKAEAKQEVTG